MSTFRHRVVVSVSATLAQLAVAGIAGDSTPGFASSIAEAESSQTVTVLNKFQHHPPNGEGLLKLSDAPVDCQSQLVDSELKTHIPFSLDYATDGTCGDAIALVPTSHNSSSTPVGVILTSQPHNSPNPPELNWNVKTLAHSNDLPDPLEPVGIAFTALPHTNGQIYGKRSRSTSTSNSQNEFGTLQPVEDVAFTALPHTNGQISGERLISTSGFNPKNEFGVVGSVEKLAFATLPHSNGQISEEQLVSTPDLNPNLEKLTFTALPHTNGQISGERLISTSGFNPKNEFGVVGSVEKLAFATLPHSNGQISEERPVSTSGFNPKNEFGVVGSVEKLAFTALPHSNGQISEEQLVSTPDLNPKNEFGVVGSVEKLTFATLPHSNGQISEEPLVSSSTWNSNNDGVVRADRTAQQTNPSPLELFVPNSPTPNFVIPEYLQPSPNPLLFPTRPQEVDIEVLQPITLAQAIELAQRNNRNLEVAQFQLERSRAALREARAALYPTVDLQADAVGQESTQQELNRERNQQLNPLLDLDDDDDPTFSVDGRLSINYNLFTAGRRDAQIKAAEEQLRSDTLEVERLREQTRLDVSNAYYDLQQADEQVRISEAAVRNAQRSLQDALSLESAGLGTRFDVLRAQVQLANENQNLITARSQQLINRRQLAQLLSLPQYANVVAADLVEIAGLWDLSLEQSIVLAFQNRAELQQQLAQRNISRQQRQIALSANRPQVDLFLNYDLLDVFDDGLGLADGYSIGGRLRWNLYDGGAANARAAQQEANIAIAESRFADARNQIRFQVEQAYFNLLSNLENIQTASVALEQAREALRLARLRFGAGVGTQTEVIDAETELTRAEANRVRAILDYNRALATLQRAISNITGRTAAIAP